MVELCPYFPVGSRLYLRFDSADRLRDVINASVAQVFGVAIEALAQPSRGTADIAFARQVAMYFAHVSGGLDYTEVGRLFGRDRSTVAHACALVEWRRDDHGLDLTLMHLERIIRQVCGLMTPKPQPLPIRPRGTDAARR